MSENKIIVGKTYEDGAGNKYKIINDLSNEEMSTDFVIIALNIAKGTIETFTKEGYSFDIRKEETREPHVLDLQLAQGNIKVGDVMQDGDLIIMVSKDIDKIKKHDSFSGTVVGSDGSDYLVGHHSNLWAFDKFKHIGAVRETSLSIQKEVMGNIEDAMLSEVLTALIRAEK